MLSKILPVLWPVLALALAGPLAAQVPSAKPVKPPLSAIGWLSRSLEGKAAPTVPLVPVPGGPLVGVPATGALANGGVPGPVIPAITPAATPTTIPLGQAAGSNAGVVAPAPTPVAPDARLTSPTDSSADRAVDNVLNGTVTGVVDGLVPNNIKVTPLKAIRKDSVGLLPESVTGLPQDFWGNSNVKTIASLIAEQPIEGVPEVQSLLYTILLAEVDAPKSSARGARLLLARTDKLMAMGALEQAQALLERAGPNQRQIFRRWFNVSLLTGHEDHACSAMRAAPGLAPNLPAQVFCLARGGDWNAAAVTLATGETLGLIPKSEADLISRFLDPGMYEGTPDLPVSKPLTPLNFVMREAIGQPRPSGPLPLAYLNTDMQQNGPWRAQLEAAERLVRSQALTPNRLIELYTERKPAASGGIWGRAAAIQAFDVALLSGNVGAVEKTLTPAYDALKKADLAVPFSLHYGARLAALKLSGTAETTAFRVALLSRGFETEARKLTPKTPRQTFLRGLALGQVKGLTPPGTLGTAIAGAFLQPMPKGALYSLLQKGDLGEAILRAMLLLKDGGASDPSGIQIALATFRAVGLESVARRTAIQLLLLGPRG